MRHAAFTGWDDEAADDVAAVVDERYAYTLRERVRRCTPAPLRVRGLGRRRASRSAVPGGGRLGVYGFGASAHIAAQVALFEGATVHVLTRSVDAQQLALELGAASAGDAYDAASRTARRSDPLAPVGDLVPVAIRALDRGGTLAIAGIHLSDIPTLSYDARCSRSARSPR